MFQSGSGTKYKPKKIFPKKKRRIDEFIIDDTSIKVGSECVWLWGIIEPKDKEIYLPYEISRLAFKYYRNCNFINLQFLYISKFYLYMSIEKGPC